MSLLEQTKLQNISMILILQKNIRRPVINFNTGINYKCHFLKIKIINLGYQVDSSGRRPDQKNVSVVRDFPVPNNSQTFKSFIGIVTYFRRFIPNFAILIKPIYPLLKDNVQFNFREDQINALEIIKSKLSEYSSGLYQNQEKF